MNSNSLLDSTNDSDIDGLYEELHHKLLQLDRKSLESEQQSEDVKRISQEKNRGCRELEKLRVENRELKDQLSKLRNAAIRAEAEKNQLQAQNSRLTTQNEQLLADHNKLATSNRKLVSDATEQQKTYTALLTKVSAWHKVYQEVSLRQSQNTLTMLDLAKRIGHAKATSLYAHQLKQQVDTSFKTSHDNIQHLQKLNSTTHPDFVSNQQFGCGGSSSSNSSSEVEQPGNCCQTVSEQLKTALQGYKDELWTGLQALDSLGKDSRK